MSDDANLSDNIRLKYWRDDNAIITLIVDVRRN